jgi:hypothetical protein
VHEFLDITKGSCADRRHRMVLHHSDLGTEIARRAFPHHRAIESVVEQHIVEDLGFLCRFADWLDRCDRHLMPTPFPRRLDAGREGVVGMIGRRLHPRVRPAVAQVFDLLTTPGRFFDTDPEVAWCVLMNAAGPVIVNRVLGGPHELVDEEGSSVIDFGWIAEAVIFTLYGRIADLGEIVRACRSEPRQ